MKINPLTQIDYYKADHISQYPKGTTLVYSNFTPRSMKYAPHLDGIDERVIFFGLQYFIKWFLIETFNNEFFKQPKEKVVGRYKRRMDSSLGPNAISMRHIEALHDLGYLPVSIRALPEGAAVNEKVPVFTIENTVPEFFWLTNYLETILSTMNWKPSTSATTAYKYKQLLTKYAVETGGDLAFVAFQAHDFSFRGMGGPQDATMSGAGHLLSFVGTDTIPAIDFHEDYYNADAEKELIGCSVPATEHATQCFATFNNGFKDGRDPSNKLSDAELAECEFIQFKHLITKVYPKGIVSIVSDSFDFWRVITDFLPRLKSDILARKGGYPIDRVVIRPDSGDPVKIIVGDPDATVGSPQYKGAIECMWDTFGGTMTEKGYRVLDSHISLIYGDSIHLARCQQIMQGLKGKGFASTNVLLGIGSFTYTCNVSRDSHGFAMKATAGIVNGTELCIYKDPKTDSGLKKSARGFLMVTKDQDGEYRLTDQVTREQAATGELKEVFRDGHLLIDQSLAEIRARVDENVRVALGR